MVTKKNLCPKAEITAMPNIDSNSIDSKCKGIILGTAVGDAIGLPYENLSRRRVQNRIKGRLKHTFVRGKGMVSDDTDHAFFVAQALIAHPDDVEAYRKRLAWSLRWWLLGMPAGIGFGTLRALMKLWVGISPEKSGVYSAGNGPAMKSALLGAVFSNDSEKLEAYLKATTRMTHTDERALIGARAIAHITRWCIVNDNTNPPAPEKFESLLKECGPDNQEWLELVQSAIKAVEKDLNVEQYASRLGQEKGVTGYMFRTVPVAVYAWYRHFGDFEAAVTSVILCGGDTDTTGAIVGAMAGATIGEEGIPDDWVSNAFVGYPPGWTELTEAGSRLAVVHAHGVPLQPIEYSIFWMALRNVEFLAQVLMHVVRRMFPPY